MRQLFAERILQPHESAAHHPKALPDNEVARLIAASAAMVSKPRLPLQRRSGLFVAKLDQYLLGHEIKKCLDFFLGQV
jgi:hypothetical protein